MVNIRKVQLNDPDSFDESEFKEELVSEYTPR